MICPKCGFDQPDNPECMRCGIIVSRYKGPIMGAGAQSPPPAYAAPAPPAPSYSPGLPPPAPAPPGIPPPPLISGGMVLPPSLPPPAASTYPGYPPPPPDSAGGTVYGGPPPGQGGGTLYQGPPPGSVAPVFSSFAATAGPVFHGTFEPGKLLSEIFSIYFRNFIPFLLLSGLVSLPLFGLAAYVSTLEKSSPEALGLFFLTLLLQFLMSQVATGGVTYGVYQQMRGGDISVVDCLRVGLSRLFPVLLVGIATFIAVVLGLMACFVGVFFVATMLAVVIPVTVEERPGLVEAMQRSVYLTKGFRWQVFAVLFLMGIIQQVLSRLAMAPAEELGSLLMASSLVSVLTTGLMATASAVMYYRLRSVKESVDVDQISSVFA